MDGNVAAAIPVAAVQSNTGLTAGTEAANAHATQARIRRRNRTIASCLECRRRKMKCDKQSPCINCTRFKRDCIYLAPALDSNSQQKLAELKDRMGSLEQTFGRDVGRRKSSDLPVIYIKEEEAEYDYSDLEDEKDLEPTPLAVLDQVYEDDADDELMDLGVQLGKMRIADRIGGFARPTMAEEVRLLNYSIATRLTKHS